VFGEHHTFLGHAHLNQIGRDHPVQIGLRLRSHNRQPAASMLKVKTGLDHPEGLDLLHCREVLDGMPGLGLGRLVESEDRVFAGDVGELRQQYPIHRIEEEASGHHDWGRQHDASDRQQGFPTAPVQIAPEHAQREGNANGDPLKAFDQTGAEQRRAATWPQTPQIAPCEQSPRCA
jgi:hypothetical protein